VRNTHAQHTRCHTVRACPNVSPTGHGEAAQGAAEQVADAQGQQLLAGVYLVPACFPRHCIAGPTPNGCTCSGCCPTQPALALPLAQPQGKRMAAALLHGCRRRAATSHSGLASSAVTTAHPPPHSSRVQPPAHAPVLPMVIASMYPTSAMVKALTNSEDTRPEGRSFSGFAKPFRPDCTWPRISTPDEEDKGRTTNGARRRAQGNGRRAKGAGQRVQVGSELGWRGCDEKECKRVARHPVCGHGGTP
jgi:hypothetical protein